MASERLFPQITTTDIQVLREMVWQQLFECGGDAGATPTELAARMIQHDKARGTVEGCAKLLIPLLDELVGVIGERRTKRDGERFKAFRVGT